MSRRLGDLIRQLPQIAFGSLEKLAANQTKALAKIGAKEEPAEGTTETRSTRRSRADKDEPAEGTTRTRRDRSAPAEEAEEPTTTPPPRVGV